MKKIIVIVGAGVVLCAGGGAEFCRRFGDSET